MAQPPSQRTMMDLLLVPKLREHFLVQETIFTFFCNGRNRNNRRENEEEKEEKALDPKDL